jgi:hypothetical protein
VAIGPVVTRGYAIGNPQLVVTRGYGTFFSPALTKTLWFEYAQALRHPELRKQPRRLLITEHDIRKRILQEAQGNKTWARYKKDAPKGDLNIEVYVDLAITNDLEPT